MTDFWRSWECISELLARRAMKRETARLTDKLANLDKALMWTCQIESGFLMRFTSAGIAPDVAIKILCASANAEFDTKTLSHLIPVGDANLIIWDTVEILNWVQFESPCPQQVQLLWRHQCFFNGGRIKLREQGNCHWRHCLWNLQTCLRWLQAWFQHLFDRDSCIHVYFKGHQGHSTPHLMNQTMDLR